MGAQEPSTDGGAGLSGGEEPEAFQLDIRAHGFQLTPELRQYAMDHLATKLAKHARRIQAVVVRLEELNGVKAGVDKVCRIEVLLPGEDPVVVEEVDGDFREAMDLAADRIEKTVSRHLERRRDKPRHRGGKVARNAKVIQ